MRSTLLSMTLACVTFGCGGSGDDSPGGNGIATQRGALTGRVSTRGGHQSVAPGTANARTDRGSAMVEADTAVARTPDGAVLGETAIAADGSYTFEGLPPTEGTVIVDAVRGDSVVGSTLVPDGVGGEGIAAMPISVETTAEAEAYEALIADGRGADEIDTVAVMDGISAEMAASVSNGGELADGVWDAQTARIGGLDASGVAVDAKSSSAARAGAYNRYAAEVHADAGDPAEAQAAYAADAAAEVEAKLGADPAAQVTAEAAAGYALSEGMADTDAADAATALAASDVADAEERAQLAHADGEVAERIEAAYDDYDAQIEVAGDAGDVAEAHGELGETLRSGDDSVFDAVLAEGADSEGFPSSLPGLDGIDGLIEDALGQAQAALDEAQAALDAALSELDDLGEAGQAFFEFREQIEAALQIEVAGLLDHDASALAVELSAAAEGNAAAFLEQD